MLAGLAPAVVAIVLSAMIRLGKKSLANGLMVAVAIVAFLAIFVVHVPFPVIVLSAGLIGLVGGALRPDLFEVGVGRGTRTPRTHRDRR